MGSSVPKMANRFFADDAAHARHHVMRSHSSRFVDDQYRVHLSNSALSSMILKKLQSHVTYPRRRSPFDNTVYQLFSYRAEHWRFSFLSGPCRFRRSRARADLKCSLHLSLEHVDALDVRILACICSLCSLSQLHVPARFLPACAAEYVGAGEFLETTLKIGWDISAI